MGGGLIQLIAVGEQDQFLTGEAPNSIIPEFKIPL